MLVPGRLGGPRALDQQELGGRGVLARADQNLLERHGKPNRGRIVGPDEAQRPLSGRPLCS